jgi:hypothetical protein
MLQWFVHMRKTIVLCMPTMSNAHGFGDHELLVQVCPSRVQWNLRNLSLPLGLWKLWFHLKTCYLVVARIEVSCEFWLGFSQKGILLALRSYLMTCSKRFFLLNTENSLKVNAEKQGPLTPFCQDISSARIQKKKCCTIMYPLVTWYSNFLM